MNKRDKVGLSQKEQLIEIIMTVIALMLLVGSFLKILFF